MRFANVRARHSQSGGKIRLRTTWTEGAGLDARSASLASSPSEAPGAPQAPTLPALERLLDQAPCAARAHFTVIRSMSTAGRDDPPSTLSVTNSIPFEAKVGNT